MRSWVEGWNILVEEDRQQTNRHVPCQIVMALSKEEDKQGREGEECWVGKRAHPPILGGQGGLIGR